MSVSPPLPIAAPSRPCATCGYDLAAHAPGATCPECGARSAEHEYIAVESIDERRRDHAFGVARWAGMITLIYLVIGAICLAIYRDLRFLDRSVPFAVIAIVAGAFWWYFTARIERQQRGPDGGSRRSLHITPDGFCHQSGSRSRRYRWSTHATVNFRTEAAPHAMSGEDACIPVVVLAGTWPLRLSVRTHMTATQLAAAGDEVRTIVAHRTDGRPPPRVLLERR